MVDIEAFLGIVEEEVSDYRVPVVDLIGVQSADPYRVLMATILSSRTKDEVTAAASRRLFEQAPDAQALQRLPRKQVERLIFPVGFYRSKSAQLLETATILNDRYRGEVPDSLERLVELPGVGRKTANLVLSVAFGKPAICVDTHVHRIMNIWGYVDTRTPEKTEMTLRRKLPKTLWSKVNRLLVAFGQGKCRPVAPHCDSCPLGDRCPRIGIVPGRQQRISG